MIGIKEKKEWRDGVFLCTVETTLEADILESKLESEGIPCVRKYKGGSNAMEIIMGNNLVFPIDIYVPSEALEDAKNIIVPVPIDEDFDENAAPAETVDKEGQPK